VNPLSFSDGSVSANHATSLDRELLGVHSWCWQKHECEIRKPRWFGDDSTISENDLVD
jgi:hypothetical protein